MRSRVEFIELIAAFVVMFPDDLNRKVGKTTVRGLLVAACQTDRVEWYLNNVRIRCRLSEADDEMLGAGTTHNEARHTFLNRCYRRTTQATSRVLEARVQMWLLSDMKTKLTAIASNTTRRFPRSTIASWASRGSVFWGAASWSEFLQTPSASLPSVPIAPRTVSRKRPGASAEQLEIWEGTHAKATHGKKPRFWQH